jgi:threonine/homoserine/homoserine lactone efflux protein
MPTLSNWLVFLGAGLLLNLTPGPDTVYVLARSVAQGRRAGAISALGIGAGCLLHLAFAVVGLSAILAQSAAAYETVKWAGATYLVVLGVRTLWRLRRGDSTLMTEHARPASLRQLFWQGLLTNLLNPKVALFFLAFLPQFVDLSAGHVSTQIAVLGATFNLTGTAWLLIIAAASGTIGSRLRANQRFALWLERAAATLFICLGLKLAASARAR